MSSGYVSSSSSQLYIIFICGRNLFTVGFNFQSFFAVLWGFFKLFRETWGIYFAVRDDVADMHAELVMGLLQEYCAWLGTSAVPNGFLIEIEFILVLLEFHVSFLDISKVIWISNKKVMVLKFIYHDRKYYTHWKSLILCLDGKPNQNKKLQEI